MFEGLGYTDLYWATLGITNIQILNEHRIILASIPGMGFLLYQLLADKLKS